MYAQGLNLNCFTFSTSHVSYRFHLAHATDSNNQLEQRETLYISQPEAHQVLRLKRMHVQQGDNESRRQLTWDEAASNAEAFIGSGERCLPGDADQCGDGGLASKARLAYPKGITAFTTEKSSELIHIVVSAKAHIASWQPWGCWKA